MDKEKEAALRRQCLSDPELAAVVKDHPDFLERAIKGFQDIVDGNNTVVTLDGLRGALVNGEPVL